MTTLCFVWFLCGHVKICYRQATSLLETWTDWRDNRVDLTSGNPWSNMSKVRVVQRRTFFLVLQLLQDERVGGGMGHMFPSSMSFWMEELWLTTGPSTQSWLGWQDTPMGGAWWALNTFAMLAPLFPDTFFSADTSDALRHVLQSSPGIHSSYSRKICISQL